jgi:DNA-binding transcriptional MerR regulator
MINKNEEFMKAYTINEVSKIIDIPAGTIRQWEKTVEGILNIPRDDKGSRYYTDFEINTLNNIKAMRDKGLSFEVIKDVLNHSEANLNVPIPSVPVMSQSEAIQTIQNLQTTIQTLAQRMESIIEESVRKEVSKISEGFVEGMTRLLPPPKDPHSERQERLTEVITRRRIETQLENEAIDLWSKLPDAERMKKIGVFRKEENRDKRDQFVKNYINLHFEVKLRIEYGLDS